jgi:hypothetical protein
MAPAFTVDLTATGGETATITIVDSINPLPGSDTWTARDRADFDTPGGFVSNWGANEADLSGPVAHVRWCCQDLGSKPTEMILDRAKKLRRR